MDPSTGRLYRSREEAAADGVEDPVEITGSPQAVMRVSRSLAAAHAAKQHRKRRAQLVRRSRRANR